MFRLKLSILIFLLTAGLAQAKEDYWDQYKIDPSDLSTEQLIIIEETLNQLRLLKSGDLKINKKVYRRLSRFNEFFGGSFNGETLLHWLLTRIKGLSYHNGKKAAINQNRGNIHVGNPFFQELSVLERLYLLIHEARHSDDKGYKHIRCPKGFRFISASQPTMDLEKEQACDDEINGAYGYQAAFLFELFAFGIFDQQEVGLLYNSSISRVFP